jgi:hypothetical protein
MLLVLPPGVWRGIDSARQAVAAALLTITGATTASAAPVEDAVFQPAADAGARYRLPARSSRKCSRTSSTVRGCRKSISYQSEALGDPEVPTGVR